MERRAPRKGFGVTFEEACRYHELREQYLSERMAAARAGEPIWVARGFDGLEASEDPGVTFNYYTKGRLSGHVEGDDLDGYHIYGPPLEEGEGAHHLNTEPVMLFSEARKKLEDYIQETKL